MENDFRSYNEEAAVLRWREEYQLIKDNPPVKGDLILASKGRIKLTIEDGFVYTWLYLPEIVNETPMWVAQSEDEERRTGWRAILLPLARDQVLERGVDKVKSLLVIGKSRSGASYLVEVFEW